MPTNYTPRPCPWCHAATEVWTQRLTGDQWVRCTQYPACRWEQPVEDGA